MIWIDDNKMRRVHESGIVRADNDLMMVVDMTTTAKTTMIMVMMKDNWWFMWHNRPTTKEHPLKPYLAFQFIDSKHEKLEIIFCHEHNKMSHSVLDSTQPPEAQRPCPWDQNSYGSWRLPRPRHIRRSNAVSWTECGCVERDRLLLYCWMENKHMRVGTAYLDS
jgi:hypothetical protein